MENLLNNELSEKSKSGVVDITKKEDEVLKEGFNPGELYWPLRVALSGQEKSPSPFEIAWVIGKKETIKRIDSAIEKL